MQGTARQAPAYRGGRPPPDLPGRDFVVVDDDLATFEGVGLGAGPGPARALADARLAPCRVAPCRVAPCRVGPCRVGPYTLVGAG
ncbi:hypothetical protein Ssi02_38360 [Sinosporangium siamense]|uniref:Uncharacterized protein n=1 Tax=Sinosporangium siamense TaxID=1367973 RepID=A0A919RIV0_9ACTN|nr:hypothetical protein Ssi02_38360 [Sinosporangium siamense]